MKRKITLQSNSRETRSEFCSLDPILLFFLLLLILISRKGGLEIQVPLFPDIRTWTNTNELEIDPKLYRAKRPSFVRIPSWPAFLKSLSVSLSSLESVIDKRKTLTTSVNHSLRSSFHLSSSASVSLSLPSQGYFSQNQWIVKCRILILVVWSFLEHVVCEEGCSLFALLNLRNIWSAGHSWYHLSLLHIISNLPILSHCLHTSLLRSWTTHWMMMMRWRIHGRELKEKVRVSVIIRLTGWVSVKNWNKYFGRWKESERKRGWRERGIMAHQISDLWEGSSGLRPGHENEQRRHLQNAHFTHLRKNSFACNWICFLKYELIFPFSPLSSHFISSFLTSPPSRSLPPKPIHSELFYSMHSSHKVID